MTSKITRTRFAPSPTGMLHVGGARTALFNYLFAKKSGDGKFVLRVEDTDLKRSSDFYAEKQYEDLCWLKLFPDYSPFEIDCEDIYKQSQRSDVYRKNLKILLDNKKAYFCFCSELELKKEKENYFLTKGRRNYKYSRKCFQLDEDEVNKKLNDNVPFSVRFLVDNKRNYKFEDGVRGLVKFSGEEVEDFVIFRKNKTPLLNFAVVVDDHEMGISHVIRAEEHLTNTAKQVALYEGLGWEVPLFFHISIIFNSERKKISKRDKTGQYLVIENLKKFGYLPQAINNYLFFLGFNPVLKESDEILSLDKMLELFDQTRFNSRPSVFSIEKLNWFNNQWIRNMSGEDFNNEAKKFLIDYSEKPMIEEIVKVFKNQINCFSELPSLVSLFFSNSIPKFELNDQTKDLVKDFYQKVVICEIWTKESVEMEIKKVINCLQKEQRKNFLLTVRRILTGVEKGPDVKTIVYLIGKEKTKEKISKFIADEKNS